MLTSIVTVLCLNAFRLKMRKGLNAGGERGGGGHRSSRCSLDKLPRGRLASAEKLKHEREKEGENDEVPGHYPHSITRSHMAGIAKMGAGVPSCQGVQTSGWCHQRQFPFTPRLASASAVTIS